MLFMLGLSEGGMSDKLEKVKKPFKKIGEKIEGAVKKITDKGEKELKKITDQGAKEVKEVWSCRCTL